MSEAQHKSQGIVGISVMVQIGETPNAELRIITSTFNRVLYRGMSKKKSNTQSHNVNFKKRRPNE